MQDANLGWVTECLVNDAISLSQTNQCGELFFAGVGGKIEMQSNLMESNLCIF